MCWNAPTAGLSCSTRPPVLVFIADENGRSCCIWDDAFTGAGVPASYIDELNEGNDIFETGTLDGVYCARYYTAGRRITVGGQDGYLFAASPMAALGSYMTDMLTMFGISAAVILILCSILCWVLAKRITGPIEDISEAARRPGQRGLTARAQDDFCVELADFATTFTIRPRGCKPSTPPRAVHGQHRPMSCARP